MNVNPNWLSVPCPLCGSLDRQIILHGNVSLFETDAHVRIARCTCGLVLTDPQPRGQDLNAFYQTPDYYTHAPPPSPLKTRLSALQLAGPLARLRLLAEKRGLILPHVSRALISHFPLKRGLRLLDFGCGSGALLRAAKQRGLTCFGVEPDRATHLADLPVATDIAGLDAIGGGGKFDRIILSHVLEHLPQPIETLQQLADRLTDGGLMRISVPNAASAQAKAFGLDWIGYDPPRHLWHFDAGSLRRAAEKAGLKEVVLTSVELPQFASATIAQLQRKGIRTKTYIHDKSAGSGAELVGVYRRA